METPIKKELVDKLISDLGITDFAKATIREVKQVAAQAEKASGVEFIKMEMGIPGLPAAQVGVDAQVKALQDGIAHSYPDIQGYPELKKEASRFVKAFIGVDVAAEGCVPVTGSMQGTYASFLTCSQAQEGKDTVLFIDPGFPVQKMQLQVMGVKYETFDVYDFRGEKLGPKLESYLKNGNICAIVYSNPNNPAWICLNEQELQAIGTLATKYDCVVMEDLAYFAMDFRKDLSVPFQPPYQPTVGRYTDNYMLLVVRRLSRMPASVLVWCVSATNCSTAISTNWHSAIRGCPSVWSSRHACFMPCHQVPATLHSTQWRLCLKLLLTATTISARRSASMASVPTN